jgi:hypothetical protein
MSDFKHSSRTANEPGKGYHKIKNKSMKSQMDLPNSFAAQSKRDSSTHVKCHLDLSQTPFASFMDGEIFPGATGPRLYRNLAPHISPPAFLPEPWPLFLRLGTGRNDPANDRVITTGQQGFLISPRAEMLRPRVEDAP